jgi:hypothetical protein
VDLLTQETLRTLIQAHEPPCTSLYQPAQRHHPDNQQDPIRFRNLVRAIEDSLGQKYRRDTRALLAPLQAMATDAAFWNRTLDGLAVLAAPGYFRVFQFQRSVKEFGVVADSFHGGRGAPVDSRALIDARKRGQVGAAGLDVHEEEEGIFIRNLSERVLQDDVLARLLAFARD